MDPMKELIPISIETVNDGAMIEGFGIELQKVLANIADPNTPATATRSVKLELILKPHSDRTVIQTEFKCDSKLAPIETHKAKIFMGFTEDGSRSPLTETRGSRFSSSGRRRLKSDCQSSLRRADALP